MKQEIEELISFRNALAHGIYGVLEPDDLRVTKPSAKDDGDKGHKLSADLMDEWLLRLEAIGDALVWARSANESPPTQP